MACVNENGQITESAKKLLKTIGTNSLTVKEISENSSIPLFKVRSSLREMKSLDFVIEENEQYNLSSSAIELLEKN